MVSACSPRSSVNHFKAECEVDVLMLRSITGASLLISLLVAPAYAERFDDFDAGFPTDDFFKDSSFQGMFKDDAWMSDNPSQKDMEADFFHNFVKEGQRKGAKGTTNSGEKLQHSDALTVGNGANAGNGASKGDEESKDDEGNEVGSRGSSEPERPASPASSNGLISPESPVRSGSPEVPGGIDSFADFDHLSEPNSAHQPDSQVKGRPVEGVPRPTRISGGSPQGDTKRPLKKKRPAPTAPVSAKAAPASQDVSITLGGCLLFPNDNGRLRCTLRVTNSGRDRSFDFSGADSSLSDNAGGKYAAPFESNLKGAIIKTGTDYYTYIQKRNISGRASGLKNLKVSIKAEGKTYSQEFSGIALLKK
jgi:hypothetical protein